MPKYTRVATAAAALLALMAAFAEPATAAASTPRSGVPVVQPLVGFTAAFAASAVTPQAPPSGVNLATCLLTPLHPRPVVMVHGTFETMLSSFGYLGPRLAKAGYCVYSYNYGGPPTSPVQAVGPVRDAVATLAGQVSAVRARTGAREVDLVGFSQGGLVSEFYTKFGGAPFVHSVTALAPTTHGTTLLGLGALAASFPGAPQALAAAGCAACRDQLIGSSVVQQLNSGPVTVPGVHYAVIDTLFEDVVTPTGSSFIREPGVVNTYVQQVSPLSIDEHVDLPFDPVTGDLVLDALARARS